MTGEARPQENARADTNRLARIELSGTCAIARRRHAARRFSTGYQPMMVEKNAT
jgi:hypothetical protein